MKLPKMMEGHKWPSRTKLESMMRPGGHWLTGPMATALFLDGEVHIPHTGDRDGLLGPVQTRGDCLAPYMSPEDIFWFERGATPRDGDFVMIQFARPVYEALRDADAFEGAPGSLAVKLYRDVDGLPMLCANSSAFFLGENRIVGVVRRIERPELAAAINAPAEGGANKTETRYSLADLGDEQSWTVELIGVSSVVVGGTMYYRVTSDGKQAMIYLKDQSIQGFGGGSSPATLGITNLPAAITPNAATRGFALTINDTDSPFALVTASSGGIGFAISKATGAALTFDANGWTTSANKGIPAGFQFVYGLYPELA